MSKDKQPLISREDVEYVARLAHLNFDQQGLDDCADKLGAILDYMQQLNHIDTSGVPATTHVLPLTNVLREDTVGATLPREQALANAPLSAEGSFKVPKIL